MSVPRWANVLYWASRTANVLDRCQQIVRDEIFFAYLPPSAWPELTIRAYAGQDWYAKGGSAFETGQLWWEAALFANPLVPKTGRVLLAAAGGGRELRWLLQHGYEVFAFDPVESLVKSARAVAAEVPGSSIEIAQGTFGDLVEAAEQGTGALSSIGGNFDVALLGWGSFSHLTDLAEAERLLRAIRRFAPRAPLLMSFWLRNDEERHFGNARYVRRGLRSMFGLVGGRSVPPGVIFRLAEGFARAFSREELRNVAHAAGYEVAELSAQDYPHALLVPKGTETSMKSSAPLPDSSTS
jgi:hypothetical protein